ncbi:MAG: DUF4271 domain-containing protein [Marinilabiliaceae bacterium]|nr:DUF4271 domain-containing protein [Marinilabiliaceae bacterium]
MTLTPRGQNCLTADSEWIFIACIIASILFGLVYLLSPNYINRIVSYSVAPHGGRGSVYDSLSLQYRNAATILTINHCFLLSVLLYEILIILGIIHETGFLKFIVILLYTTLYEVAKYSIHWMIGYAFDEAQQTTNILRHKEISSHLMTIIILPIALLLPYISETSAKTLLIILLASYIVICMWRFTQLLKENSYTIVSIFYIFLYLCAVEIAPIIVITKTLWAI